MKEAAGVGLQLLKKAVKLAAEVSGDAGVPGLSAGLSAVGDILETIQVGSLAHPTLFSPDPTHGRRCRRRSRVSRP